MCIIGGKQIFIITFFSQIYVRYNPLLIFFFGGGGGVLCSDRPYQ